MHHATSPINRRSTHVRLASPLASRPLPHRGRKDRGPPGPGEDAVMRELPARLEPHRLPPRAPRPDDAAVLLATYTQDPDVSRYMIWAPHARVEETRAYIDRSIAEWDAGTAFPYVITTHDGAPIGMIEARLRAPAA